MLVDYSHQAYILSCNDTDYSFFGSLNYQQTGVHVEGIAGHNSAPPRCPARPRRDFIFNLSMCESKASPVVVCLHHAGGRRHFRLGVSSSVGHCCQHFWVGWEPNRIKGEPRLGKCQRDKQVLRNFLVGFSWTSLMLLCTRVPKLHVPTAEL